MDLHPLFVHFPIALLTVYSFFEVLRTWEKNPHWITVRAVLVVSGVLGAFISLSTGEVAEHLYQGTPELHQILEVHGFMGGATTWIYAILAACYIILWMETHTTLLGTPPKAIAKPVVVARKIANTILQSWIAPALAVLGFIALSLTGALGAMLVYGPDFDPITKIVYQLLF